MTTVHEYLAGLTADGAELFATMPLAGDHDLLAHEVRRQRTRRTVTGSLITLGVAAALALSASQLPEPGIAPSVGAPSPSASANASPLISVYPGERAEEIAGELATMYGVSRPVAYQALADAAPREALGNPEGWVSVGNYTFGAGTNLYEATDQLVAVQVMYLTALGVPREDWLQTVIMASIVQQEAPGISDQSSMARLLLNRLDAGVPLHVTSVEQYAAKGIYHVRYSSLWPEAQYNMHDRLGLPPTAIGAADHEAVEAIVHPATGDWMGFTRDTSGAVVFYDDDHLG